MLCVRDQNYPTFQKKDKINNVFYYLPSDYRMLKDIPVICCAEASTNQAYLHMEYVATTWVNCHQSNVWLISVLSSHSQCPTGNQSSGARGSGLSFPPLNVVTADSRDACAGSTAQRCMLVWDGANKSLNPSSLGRPSGLPRPEHVWLGRIVEVVQLGSGHVALQKDVGGCSHSNRFKSV